MLQHVIEKAVFENTTALIIEDDAHCLMALGSLLNGLCIRYKRNTTGAGVMQQARRLQPDFILLDMDLPDGDPLLIRAALRADPTLGHVPVIAIADSAIIDQLPARMDGAEFAGIVPKPIAQHDFTDLLGTVLVAN